MSPLARIMVRNCNNRGNWIINDSLTNTPTTTSADRWRMRRALGLWIVLAVAVCIKPFLQGSEHSVYPVFAGASRHWWADMPLYAEYFGTEKTDGYRYSPTFAVAFTPFVMLPEEAGNAAWNLLGIGLLLASLHVLVRDVLPLPDTARARGTEGDRLRFGPVSSPWRWSAWSATPPTQSRNRLSHPIQSRDQQLCTPQSRDRRSRPCLRESPAILTPSS